MRCDPNGAVPVNSYALVTYVPEPLGSFLDGLRQTLVPACNLQSHVTILPPRPLGSSADSAWLRVRDLAASTPSFEVELRDVEVFAVSSVIYLAVGHGDAELRAMHEALNLGELGCVETFHYHPHITLAQDIRPEEVPGMVETARRLWAEYAGPRRFRAESVTFVQNTDQNIWIDLAEAQLTSLKPVER